MQKTNSILQCQYFTKTEETGCECSTSEYFFKGTSNEEPGSENGIKPSQPLNEMNDTAHDAQKKENSSEEAVTDPLLVPQGESEERQRVTSSGDDPNMIPEVSFSTNVPDGASCNKSKNCVSDIAEDNVVKVKQGNFSWDVEKKTPILKDINIKIPQGKYLYCVKKSSKMGMGSQEKIKC